MLLASLYVLASKVKAKLTKQAADPRSSLRSLVLQANMLDNVMDHIATETKRVQLEKASKVSFAVPEKRVYSPSRLQVTEYEIEYELDSSSEYDSESDSDLADDEDEYYYYSSDSDSEDIITQVAPTMLHRQLLIIPEQEEVPELTYLVSSSDADSEDDFHFPNYVLAAPQQSKTIDPADEPLQMPRQVKIQGHHRSDAAYAIEAVF